METGGESMSTKAYCGIDEVEAGTGRYATARRIAGEPDVNN